MSHTIIKLVMATLAATSLAACGEKPQTTSARKSDTQAWQGTANLARADTGWTGGDRDKWVLHMQTRANNQNEYTRTSLPPRAPAP